MANLITNLEEKSYYVNYIPFRWSNPWSQKNLFHSWRQRNHPNLPNNHRNRSHERLENRNDTSLWQQNWIRHRIKKRNRIIRQSNSITLHPRSSSPKLDSLQRICNSWNPKRNLPTWRSSHSIHSCRSCTHEQIPQRTLPLTLSQLCYLQILIIYYHLFI